MMLKTVLVTGAAKRLGRAIALDLAAAGWNVAVHYFGSKADAEGTEPSCASWVSGARFSPPISPRKRRRRN